MQMTDFDSIIADPQLQMMKAAIPYMQLPQQRMFSMFIKVQEFQKTMNLFREGELSAMGFDSNEQKNPSPMELLQLFKNYAGPNEREMIDNLENMQLMMQVMQSGNL